MLVIGIDPGIAITGYGIVLESGSRLENVDYGVIQTKATETLGKRLELLYNRVKSILVLHEPKVAAVEKLYYQRNITTAVSVGQARGVVMLAVSEYGIPVYEYSQRRSNNPLQDMVGRRNSKSSK